VLVPRQPSPRMADAVRQLLQTMPGAIFEEIWAAATLAAAADEEMWSAAFATADKVARELAPHAALETIWSSMLAAAEEEMGIAR
jgi:hypothetical protein